MKKHSSLCYDGWYVQHGSHLHFLKLSSTKIISTSFWKICFSKILLEIVSRMKIIISTPFLFLSNLYDLEKPSIKDIDSKKVSSSFVSVITRMSIYFSTVFFNCSNLTYKHMTWIPLWNDLEKFVSTSFQRGIHVMCL